MGKKEPLTKQQIYYKTIGGITAEAGKAFETWWQKKVGHLSAYYRRKALVILLREVLNKLEQET